MAPATGHPLQGRVWDRAAGAEITPETLLQRLHEADVTILGETHDNSVHHARQAWLIAGLAPSGVAFEMIPAASEKGIAVFREDGGRAAEIGPAIGWERLGWPDWALYRPIFEAAGDAVLTGGGVARAALGAAMREGAAVAYGRGAADLGLERALPAYAQAAAEAEMMAAHCDLLPAESAGGMVEAQRLRDASFAAATLRAREAGGGPVALITGNGHARTDRGVPVYLARVAPELTLISLGQIETVEGRDDPADYAAAHASGPDGLVYDYVWFSAGVPGRSDPCAVFQ
ncbi:MAG: ChaN family lipoprotein [Pseudomonadota bacterium]